MIMFDDIKINTVQDAGGGYYRLNGTQHVPPCPGNREYQAIQEWIAQGNVPDQKDSVVEDNPIDQPLTTKGLVNLLESSSELINDPSLAKLLQTLKSQDKSDARFSNINNRN